MSETKPTSYEATTEYQKEIRRSSGPKNVPAAVMAKMRGAALLDLLGGQDSRPGGALAVKWNNYTKDQRMEMVAGMGSVDELRAVMAVEDDNEVLRFMVDKKETLEEVPA